MVIYRSVDDAVRSAIAMQQCCQRHSKDLAPEDKVLLCIGIGYGDVLRIGEHDVYGAEVNAACKLGEDTPPRTTFCSPRQWRMPSRCRRAPG